MAQAEATLRPGFRIFDPELGLARAGTAVCGGDLPAGRREALRVAAQAKADGNHAYAALALHEVARLGDASAVSDQLQALLDRLDGPIVRIYAEHSRALATGDAGALDQAGAAFEGIGAQLLAAEAFAEASAAHRAQGSAARSARSATMATQLIERCGQPATPALANIGNAALLTRRQREVASLAASGLSNQAIADRLVVSVRTVEQHLEHTFQKLGASNRGQLARLLGIPTVPGRGRASP